MRVTRLVLKNWGPHQNLDIDMDTPVFGLIGPNGSGKTNLLSAISFAFTGLLEKNQKTYVRQKAGVEINNGSVDLYFQKHGVKGRIFRQVGASPKRTLWWDDWSKPIEKAAEVDKLMSQILDCDKQAIDEAVFLSQGHLADFLQGTPTAREENFARMCLIDRLGQVSDIAGQEIARIQKTITDLTSQRDEALTTRDQTEAALRTVESELELHPDRVQELTWARQALTAAQQLKQKQTQSQVLLGDLQTAREKLSTIVKPAFIADQDPHALGDELNTNLTKARAAFAESKRLKQEADSAAQNRQSLTQVKNQVQDILGNTGRLLEIQTELDGSLQDLIAAQEYGAHLKVTESWNKARTEVLQALERGREELDKLPVEAVLRQTFADTSTALTALIGNKFRLDLAKTAEGHSQGCCPLCLGTDLSRLPSGDQLASELAALNQEEAELRKMQAEAETQLQTRNRYQARYDQLLEQKVKIDGENPGAYAGRTDVAPEKAQELEARRQKLEAERADLQAKLGLVTSLNQRQEQLELILATALLPAEYQAQIEAQDRIAAQEAELQTNLTALRDWVKLTEQHTQGIQNTEALIKQAAQETEKLESECSKLWNMKPKALELLTIQSEAAFQETIVSLQTKQAERERVQGMISAHTDSLRRAENRVKEIEDRAKRNALTMTVIGHLEELKNAFSRHGIPRHYLTKVFERLVAMTQESLAEWETDFQVERDTENLFNFMFYRNDDPDTLLDQQQLSGGQRTRLALSFVQAVQRLLYPGLDFLCVDEPSNHLDAEGKEGLIRLFHTIAKQNTEGDSQVIVVDHDPMLQRAFSKCISLDRLV